MQDAGCPWRAQFIDLAHELRRQAGKPAASFQDTTEAPIEMKFRLDGILFRVAHLDCSGPTADRFLMQCHFGPLVMEQVDKALEQALSLNLGMARSSWGVFGIDESLDELVYSCFVSLHGATSETISEALRHLVLLAHEWRTVHSVALH